MRIAFRVDASVAIGTGHFYRCFTLAELLRARGASVVFVSRDLPVHLAAALKSESIESLSLSRIGNSFSQAEDASETSSALAGSDVDWLVIDSYSLDIEWERRLCSHAANLCVLDDLADRRHDCQLLIDQNFYSNAALRYASLVPAYCKQLLGPHYSLLRPGFAQRRRKKDRRATDPMRLLVFYGGTDPTNLTAVAIQALSLIKNRNLEVHVVVGAANPNASDIAKACAVAGYHCHVETKRMPELMSDADLSLGAGGTAVWERCCVGLPTMVYSAAPNQHRQVKDLAKEGYIYAPDEGDFPPSPAILAEHLRALMDNASLRQAFSSAGMRLVDGEGARRVTDCLMPDTVRIRRATTSDSKKLFDWRNHQSVRSYSRSSELIGWESHVKWFAAALQSPDRIILIGENLGEPIGVVRFDIAQKGAEVSIYLAPGSSGRGLGRRLLQSAEAWLVSDRPDVMSIRAFVRDTNHSSKGLFRSLDYKVEALYLEKRIRKHDH